MTTTPTMPEGMPARALNLLFGLGVSVNGDLWADTLAWGRKRGEGLTEHLLAYAYITRLGLKVMAIGRDKETENGEAP